MAFFCCSIDEKFCFPKILGYELDPSIAEILPVLSLVLWKNKNVRRINKVFDSQAWILVLHHGVFKDETTKSCIAPFLSRIVHVTTRKQGTFWREEEKRPWERSWNTDTKKQTRHRSRANRESQHSAQPAGGRQTHFSSLVSPAEKITTWVKQQPKNTSASCRLPNRRN